MFDSETILSHLDAEIERLRRVRTLLSGSETTSQPEVPKVKRSYTKRKPMSQEARDRMSAAQKLRWSAWAKAQKKAA